MPHKSQRKERQRQQKMQLQEHQPQQRVQRRQREHRGQRQWQERQRERQEERREESPTREQQRTRETIQESSNRMDKGNQTDISQPFIYPEPQVEQIQEQFQDPQAQHLSPSSHFRLFISVLSAVFCLGFLIGQITTWRVPRAGEALHMAIGVFALEVGRVLLKPVNELMKFWAHVVSMHGGFMEYVLLLVMLTMLIKHYGQMYIVREEPVEEDVPSGEEYDSDKSSEDDFYSLDDFWAVESALEMVRSDSGSESDSVSGDVVARAA